ncbi:helix-turn-helix domain-containing protein (plasmid) [Skermanella rosea]|uniref:helix-turn-helix domain-containing protein n=1 Tax=Skermanella rosea TaxID=1817965 RepID=UPI001931DDB6|nr:helix-turn-helix domain-containing protein [Skermanella rosea]UEM08033.1 helix-turn-helix domain-containing protein [Skermanella rosea]
MTTQSRRRVLCIELSGPYPLKITAPAHMTGEQFATARTRLGLSREQYADLIGRDPETVRQREKGEEVPPEAALLMRVLTGYGVRAEATMAERRKPGPPRPTHCRNGHEFTPENSYVSKGRGTRACRTCRRARDAENRKKDFHH